MGLTITGTKALQRKLRAKEREMKRAELGALGEAATVLEKDIKARVFPVRRVSKQDAPGGRTISLAGVSPVRTTIDRAKSTAAVRVARHWTTARTPAVRAVLTRFGQGAKLTRKGLYVGRDEEFVRFDREPRLLAWARARGQVQRHKVRLSNPAAIKALQVAPAAAQAYPKIHRIWLDATRRALRS